MSSTLVKYLAIFGFFSSAANAKNIDCKDSQKLILNFSSKDLEKVVPNQIIFNELSPFVQSLPTIENSIINVTGFVSPDQDYDELWCKMKSQEAIASELKIEALGPPASCGKLLEKVLIESLKEILEDPAKLPSLESLGIIIDEDREFSSNLSWINSTVSFRYTDTYIHLKASQLRTPNWIPQIGGMNYCKVLSGPGATKFLTDVLENYYSSIIR
jgi:hypothetical protein